MYVYFTQARIKGAGAWPWANNGYQRIDGSWRIILLFFYLIRNIWI